MQEKTELIYEFTPAMIDTIAHIWTCSSIKLIDVRFKDISTPSSLQQYRMPSSMLVYTYGGAANIRLNQTVFRMERFGIVHGGKGTTLSITPEEDKLGAFMVFYKSEKPLFFEKDLQRLLEQVNPFVQQFGYAPSNPVSLVDVFQQMINSWNGERALGQLYTKSLFYQLIHEIYRDLERDEVGFLQPDAAISAKHYLDEHYMKPILFQDIADLFGISGGQLTRLFKKREGISLQEYLTLKRLNAVQYHLKHTNATVKEIAHGCGFIDENLLLRAFKKRYKMSPGEYRKKLKLSMQGLSVDNDSHQLYNEIGLTSLAKFQRDGELTMFGQIRSKEMILAAAVSLMMLLSACSSNVAVNNGATSSQTPAQTQQTEVSAVDSNGQIEAMTRVVKTVKGDVEVPANPQKIIATYGIGDLVALGATLVATYDAKGTAFEDEVANLPVWAAFETEDIMAYDPDLIFVVNEEQYNKVSKIAPTILIPFTELSMEERITFLGEVLSKEAEAQKLLSDFNEKVVAAKKLLEETEITSKTFSLMEGGNGSVWVFGDKWGRGGDLLYSHLGLKAPKVIQEEIIGKDQYRDVSMEVIGDYAGDYIIYSGELGDLEGNPVWESLPAVTSGNIIFIDYDLFYNIDIFSTNVQLDYIMDQLADR